MYHNILNILIKGEVIMLIERRCHEVFRFIYSKTGWVLGKAFIIQGG